jgi:hypothetical protein
MRLIVLGIPKESESKVATRFIESACEGKPSTRTVGVVGGDCAPGDGDRVHSPMLDGVEGVGAEQHSPRTPNHHLLARIGHGKHESQ